MRYRDPRARDRRSSLIAAALALSALAGIFALLVQLGFTRLLLPASAAGLTRHPPALERA